MSFVRNKYSARDCYSSVGKGWWPLIRVLWKYKPDNINIVQVKEKFGVLRVYTDCINDRYDAVIDALETLSSRICEGCGAKGRLDTSHYWMQTLCKSCKAMEDAKYGDS